MKYKVSSKYADFENELLHIKEHFDSSDQSIHKARNELRISEINEKKVVIKAFKVPHIINQFAYAHIRDGKAKKSYDNSIKLQNLYVNTPDAIAYIEFYSFGLLKESYFLSIYEPYDFTIREVFHRKVDNYSEILELFATFTYDLHVKGIWHVDYSPGNVLISKENDTYRFSLVDINRMEFKEIKDYEGLKNFAKFWAKDEDLKIIALKYASLASLDKDKAVEVALKAAKNLQDKTNLKRKLKAK